MLWLLFKDERGKWRKKTTGLPVGRERDAKAVLKVVEARIRAGAELLSGVEGPLTVELYFARWIELRTRRGLVSVQDDATRIRKHVLPTIGHARIEDVRPKDIRSLFHSLAEKVVAGKMAPKSVHNIKGTLNTMFRDAVSDELISANPVTLRPDDLPPKIDKDPAWRRTAIFDRAEVEMLMRDCRVPLHRRVRYALLFLSGARLGEAGGLVFSDYEQEVEPLGRLVFSKQWHTKRQATAPLKTARKGITSREMPVHPVLADILDYWWREGWERTYGRTPRNEDIIIPNPFVPGKGRRVGGPTTHVRSDTVWSDLDADCRALGIRHRRTHDLRRTFITLASEDGARRDILKWGTHGRPRADIMDGYTEVFWKPLCIEVAKLRFSIGGPFEPDPRDETAFAQSIAQGPAGTWNGRKKEMEPAGIEPASENNSPKDNYVRSPTINVALGGARGARARRAIR